MGVIVFQWLCLCVLLAQHQEWAYMGSVGSTPPLVPRSITPLPTGEQDSAAPHSLPGVGVTILYRSPKWFHLRLTHMLHNAHTNLPPGWGIHVFMNPDWVFGDAQVLSWHPGLQRMLRRRSGTTTTHPSETTDTTHQSSSSYRGTWRGRHLFVSWLPHHLTQRPARPKDVLHDLWFWEQLTAAERVLLFSGNGVFCGNHMVSAAAAATAFSWPNKHKEHSNGTTTTIWQVFGWIPPQSSGEQQSNSASLNVDYLASPWRQLQGMGGDGSSHSYRNRTSMVRLLQYAKNDRKDQDWKRSPEHVWVVRTMQRYNTEYANTPGAELFRIATPEQTELFGGVLGLTEQDALVKVPYVASGTFANLAWDERDTLLKHCPELKTIFPSLHEPACFGAHPQAETCRQSICALQEFVPSSGC